MATENAPEGQRTCFVVMGFGKKYDYPTKRTLDLDKSYHNLIKPAVEEAGLKCIRADEIKHSGIIDVPMYEQLLNADVVVADLSTSNSNAFYELGVRHALRPYTTIIISDNKLKYPFDVNHIAIRGYEHLGTDIGYSEVIRFKTELKEAIAVILGKKPEPDYDSPVYQFLTGLRRPTIAEQTAAAAAEAAAKSAPEEPAPAGPSLATLMQEADQLIANAEGPEDLLEAKRKLKQARKIMKPPPPDGPGAPGRQEEPYIIQRLALATYKSKFPSALEALEEARGLLQTLNPRSSSDPETLGLWGAVHKRMWEVTGEKERAHLDEAVHAYERGYYVREDYYNGINFAYLLNVRAAMRADPAEAVTDFVLARRVRNEVVPICERELAELAAPPPEADQGARDKYRENRYWILATLAEAYAGLGKDEEAERMLEQASQVATAAWMRQSTDEQIAKLRKLLAASPLKYVKADGR